MVGSYTDFVPDYPLFFTHRGRKKLYELLGINSHKGFMQIMNQMEKENGITEEVYEKIILAGIIWKHPEATFETVDELMEAFSLMENGYEDLDKIVVDALANSGIYDKELVKAFRDLKTSQLSPEKMQSVIQDQIKAKLGEGKGESKVPPNPGMKSKTLIT